MNRIVRLYAIRWRPDGTPYVSEDDFSETQMFYRLAMKDRAKLGASMLPSTGMVCLSRRTSALHETVEQAILHEQATLEAKRKEVEGELAGVLKGLQRLDELERRRKI